MGSLLLFILTRLNLRSSVVNIVGVYRALRLNNFGLYLRDLLRRQLLRRFGLVPIVPLALRAALRRQHLAGFPLVAADQALSNILHFNMIIIFIILKSTLKAPEAYQDKTY